MTRRYIVLDADVFTNYVHAVNGMLTHLALDEDAVGDALLYTAATEDLLDAIGAR